MSEPSKIIFHGEVSFEDLDITKNKDNSGDEDFKNIRIQAFIK